MRGRSGSRRCRPLIATVVALATTTCTAACRNGEEVGATALADGSPSNAVAVSVIDGDTIEVDISGDTVVVRLIGIDTPEKTGGIRPAECFGDEATTRTAELVTAGQPLRLELDVESRDQYNRLLAYVHTGTSFVNEVLVAEGYAAAMRFEPNTFHASRFAAAQDQARSLGLGLWSQCGGVDVVIR